MGQILVRNLDEDLIADYREAAKRHNRSMEAEVREALMAMRPRRPQRVEELRELARRISAMTPEGVQQTPSEDIVRQMRDGADFRAKSSTPASS